MNECWKNNMIVFYFPKGKDRDFQSLFNQKLSHFREFGLIEKWTSDEMDKAAFQLSAKTANQQQLSDHSTLLLEDVRVAFFIVSLGLVLSFAAFVLEFVIKSSSRRGTSEYEQHD